MTNQWTDIKNAKCIVICGSNAAENHPMAFRWVTKAIEENDAKLIVIDPRFTRSAAKAHIFVQHRPGADLVLFGGLINHVLEKKLWDEDYVLAHTNALYRVNPAFSFKDGIFSGYDQAKRKYDMATWTYQLGPNGKPLKAASVDDPDCVFAKLKEHYSRYDGDTVSKVTGIPKDKFLEIAKTIAENRPGTLLYAMGLTQHTGGSALIACYAMLQLLLGNTGKPGGGINALRGEPNVQGSTDMAALFHIIPAYLAAPTHKDTNLLEWTKASGTLRRKFLIALLKAWFGDASTAENDWSFGYLPKRNGTKPYSYTDMMNAMYAGTIKGAICMGQNILVGAPNANLMQAALEKLGWLVVVDLFQNETAAFWKAPGANPEAIDTEVFLLPACGPYEKEGSFVDSGRKVQWKYKAVDGPGEALPDLDIVTELAMKLKELYAGSTDPKDRPILDLTWDYGDPPDPEAVLKEINGYDLTTGKLLPGIAALVAATPGTASCGAWIYPGVFADGENKAARRDPADESGLGLHPKWGYSWPANVRIIYNRASCDAAGKPYDPDNKLIWWDAAKGEWAGYDVPDVPNKTKGPDDPAGKIAYRILAEGVGRLFYAKYMNPPVVPKPGEPPPPADLAKIGVAASPTLADGPLPEHYEPVESPVRNEINPADLNPVVKLFEGDYHKYGEPSRYPIVLTTYRLVEHWQTGAMTRNQSWLAEIMPHNFAEIGTELADEKGISSGDMVELETARGKIRLPACVTDRIKPLSVGGKTVHVVGTFWHWGFMGLVTGPIGNELTMDVGDANTRIPQYKACLCDIRKVK